MIRFTESNWNRFFTHDKKTTIRLHAIKPGVHNVYLGPRFKPKFLGKVKIGEAISCLWRDLDEQDAKNDGFNSLKELLEELLKLNKGKITSRAIPVYRHPATVIQIGGQK